MPLLRIRTELFKRVVMDCKSILISPPSITYSNPLSSVSDISGANRAFNITVDQTVNVTWYINGTQVQFNESVI